MEREQQDLEISRPATITDLDEQRGILAWDMQIGAGETREIRVQSSLNWPTEFILQ